jgi:hypothetical protein
MNDSEIWQSDYEWLSKEMGAQITKRKIRKLSFIHDGKVMVAEIGKPNPYNGQPLRKIYEDGSRGCFLLCGGPPAIAPKDSLVEEY